MPLTSTRLWVILLFNQAPWKNCKVYQEYPVKRIAEDWKDHKAKYDWVI